jgi:hypothetical protein
LIDEWQTGLPVGAGLGYSRSMRTPSPARLDTGAAEEIAVAALGFVAADPVLLPRFLAISGIEAAAIRQAAREPGFLAGVLQFLMAHEPTLAAFCEASGERPPRIAAALAALPFGDDRFEAST